MDTESYDCAHDVYRLRPYLINIFNRVFDKYGPFKFTWQFNFIADTNTNEVKKVEYFQPTELAERVINNEEIPELIDNLLETVIDRYVPGCDFEGSGYRYIGASIFSVTFYIYMNH